MPDKKPTHDLSDEQRAELERFAQSLRERNRSNTLAADEATRNDMKQFTEQLQREARQREAEDGGAEQRHHDDGAEPRTAAPSPTAGPSADPPPVAPPPARGGAPLTVPVPDLPALSDLPPPSPRSLEPTTTHPTVDRPESASSGQAPRRWTPPERSAIVVTESRPSGSDPARTWKILTLVLGLAVISLLAVAAFGGGGEIESDDPTSTSVPIVEAPGDG